MDQAIRYWQHRVSYEGGLDILRTSKRLTIGFSDIAADSESCDAMGLGDWNKYCQRYKEIYKGNIPRNKAVLWRFVVEMSIGDVVVVPVPYGFQIYRITSGAIRIEKNVGDPRDLGWYRRVEEIAAECTPREAYASQLVSAMRCQKTNIEITRLASEIEQAIEKRNSETELAVKDEIQRPYRMGTPEDIAKEMLDGVLDIPAVQRGYVWNASQIEVLWDSIMRQIPIGTFSVRPKCADGRIVWELIDGQQRATSIEIAYHSFPPTADDYRRNDDKDLTIERKTDKALTSPILWIDLDPDGQKEITREYLFRVTTEAHPWGYKFSEDEKTTSTLDVKYRRRSVDGLQWHRKPNPLEDARPYPSELWPITAHMPVPFQLLNRYIHEEIAKDDDGENIQNVFSLGAFVDFCCKERKAKGNAVGGRTVFVWNWLDHFLASMPKVEDERYDKLSESLRRFAAAVLNTKDFVIFQQNALRVDSNSIGVYFKRIGRGGSVPSEEEINYSLLKVKIPILKDVMDKIAERGITSAAHMADIAIRVWYSIKKESAVWEVSTPMLMSVCGEERAEFTQFIQGEENDKKSFRYLLHRVDEELGVSKAKFRLLHWHRAQFCTKSASRLFQYLLMHAANPEEGIDYAGLASFILFHSNHLNRVVNNLQTSKSVQEGLIRAYKDSYYSKYDLIAPVFPSQLQVFQTAVNSEDWVESLNQAFNATPDNAAVELLTKGYAESSQYAILLYATRFFVDAVFPAYDANCRLWADENRPWDYDHILPQSWVDAGHVFYKWDQENTGGVVSRLINSLGNLAPLPFSINRAKSDEAPSCTYPFVADYKDVLVIDDYHKKLILTFDGQQFEDIDYKKLCECPSKESARQVCKYIIERMIYMYKSWFHELSIDQLLDFSSLKDARKELFEHELMKRDGWRLSSSEGQTIVYEDKKRTDFMWRTQETIELTHLHSVDAQTAEIVYTDRIDINDIDTCCLGVRKRAGLNSLPVDIFMKDKVKLAGFVVGDGAGLWQITKVYPKRPTGEELDDDIELLIEVINSAATRNS